MARNTTTSSVDPIVAALAQRRNREPLLDRVMAKTATALNGGTKAAGQLWEAVDLERFEDGAAQQRYLNAKRRKDDWADFAERNGLNPEDVALLIAN